MREWNFELTAGSVAGAIVKVTERELLRLLFGEILDPDLASAYLGRGFHPFLGTVTMYMDRSLWRLEELLGEEEWEWFGERRTREDMLLLALERAVAYLHETLGEDIAGWQWGRLHQLTLAHPLGVAWPLNLLLNRGPLSAGRRRRHRPPGLYSRPRFLCRRCLLPLLPPDHRLRRLGELSSHPCAGPVGSNGAI